MREPLALLRKPELSRVVGLLQRSAFYEMTHEHEYNAISAIRLR